MNGAQRKIFEMLVESQFWPPASWTCWSPQAPPIRYVPADASKPINADPIVAHIREILHPQLDVIFKAVEKTPLKSGGKHQRIVCEIPA